MCQSLYSRYLNVLNISKRKPSLDALTQILRAHLWNVPFENISKIYFLKKYGLNTIPDFEAFLEGISKYHFGGTCYSINHHLNKLLNYLGYDVQLCGADMSKPDVHMVNIVTIENRLYLVDAGYAAPFLEPLPLDLTVNYELNFGRYTYILVPQNSNKHSELLLFLDGKRKHGYTVKPAAKSISDFKAVIADSMHNSATFFNSLLVAKFSKKDSTIIDNYALFTYDGTRSNEKLINSNEELAQLISKKFNISEEIVFEVLSEIPKYKDSRI